MCIRDRAGVSDSVLVMEATAKTYRYLDANEVAAKKKAEKDKLAQKG